MITAGAWLMAPVEDVAAAVTDSRIYVWAATVVVVAGLLLGLADKIGGRIAKVRAWMLEHRRTAREQSAADGDARITELQDQITDLQASHRGLRDTVEEQRLRHAEDWRDWRRERTAWQAMVTALTGHAWAWRRAHDAAGHPYTPPKTPTQPDGIGDYLTDWPTD